MTKEQQLNQEDRQIVKAMDNEAEKMDIITKDDILTYIHVVHKLNDYDAMLEALKKHHNFLSLLLGSSSLERIERFDLLEKAKELFHSEPIKPIDLIKPDSLFERMADIVKTNVKNNYNIDL